MKYQVNVEGTEVTLGTIKEVCEVLGRKVSKKDIIDGLVEDVAIVEEEDIEVVEDTVEEEPVAAVEEVEETVEEEVPVAVSAVEEIDDEEEDTEEEDTVEEGSSMAELMEKMRALNAKKNAEKAKKEKAEEIVFDGNYPEIGTFTEVNQLKKFYKKLSDTQLDEWLELEGWSDEVKHNDNAGILRMRKCMVIRGKHFPSNSKKKSKSKYADYSTEQLLEMCLENDVDVKDANGNERILRMYAIMGLRQAGLLE